MIDVVSFETALKLKNAGFLQPNPEAGQFWYGKKTAGDAEPGSLCVLIGTETGDLRFCPIDGKENELNKFFVFAPTAAYIVFKTEERGASEGKTLNGLSEAAASLWLLKNGL